ncbi:MAG: hypothetical protein K0R62_6290 [Nonomuraea muscovyensis]|nr:hypothetical protein [Nonomuraea muscovyensis]
MSGSLHELLKLQQIELVIRCASGVPAWPSADHIAQAGHLAEARHNGLHDATGVLR